ncbi:alpha/beta fold hydrolase [Chitinophaga arvensicola]|uniref:Alpha/beta hydrolase family protein n=1 Tax=Chitinophaga arvensicola TaxID=29529 RepID=A0A1I0S9R2_9BACT|nr:alpha/beta fold hydrolase [Chitinophaga arvensicola]SEW52918.1 Alpha/beta hydrolase family protein [Chitinophaga arvensicola]
MNYKRIRLVVISTLLSLLLFGESYAQSPKTQPPVYVLVHGAWHGGWCWQQVSSILRGNGATVYTPTLSGLGEHRNILSPDVNLETHITDIVNVIEMEDLHDVILVGHSYAGAVIAGVADRIPQRLRKLVFLDPVLVESGQSVLSAINSALVTADVTKAAAKDGGLTIPAWPVSIFGIKDTADARWVGQRLTAQPYRTFTQKLTLSHPFGNQLPLIFIACTAEINPEFAHFARNVRKDKKWKYFELATAHDAMMTAPKETAALIKSLAD